MMSPRTKVVAVVGLTAALVAPTAAVAGSKWSDFPPRGGETISVLPAGQDNPSIANGVAIGPEAAIYKTSGLGPSRLNTTASNLANADSVASADGGPYRAKQVVFRAVQMGGRRLGGTTRE